MTGMLTMYDSAFNSQYPPGAAAYAAYVDGGIGSQPNYGYIVATFPAAHRLSIALDPAHNADALDIEPFAAKVASAAGWYARQKARGIARPCLYASASTMESFIVPAVGAAQIARAEVRLWSAHYGAGEHICGPGSCGAMSIDADGTQWTDRALGRDLDQSLLRDDFFGAPTPHPTANWTEFDMAKLRVLKQDDSDQPGEFWAVHRLQALLAEAGKILAVPAAAVTACDGQFGPKTAAAVRAVQAHYGITVDGIVAAQTWGVLLTGSPA